MSNLKIGATLFSFTSGYIKGKLDLEGCIRTAAEIGCEGYEIVATQMLPHYPFVTDEDIGFFNRMTKEYGVSPVSYGANMDRGMRHDRDLTDDEMVAMAVRDIQNAQKMGCTVMREQYMMPPKAFIRLAPYAETYGVKVGIEIHNPEYPSSPFMQEYLDMIKADGTKYLGFIPDFGCFATKPNKPHWDRALANGASLEHLEMARDMRYEGVPQDEAIKRLNEAGANGAVIGALAGMYGFVQFRKKPDLEGLKAIMPHCFEFHGKCHYISEELVESSIPYETVLPVILDSDYDGYIVAEYENEGGYDEIEITKRNISMVRKIMAANMV